MTTRDLARKIRESYNPEGRMYERWKEARRALRVNETQRRLQRTRTTPMSPREVRHTQMPALPEPSVSIFDQPRVPAPALQVNPGIMDNNVELVMIVTHSLNAP